jgi:hypothetical protein
LQQQFVRGNPVHEHYAYPDASTTRHYAAASLRPGTYNLLQWLQTAWMATEDAAKLLQQLVLCCSYVTKAAGKQGCLSCAACFLQTWKSHPNITIATALSNYN